MKKIIVCLCAMAVLFSLGGMVQAYPTYYMRIGLKIPKYFR